jgi:hypothetical protein
MLFVAMSLSASAQLYPRNIVSIRGGMNLSSMSQKVGEVRITENRKPKVGWHIGVVDEVLLKHDLPLYLDVGVMLTNKGVRYVEKGIVPGSIDARTRTVKQIGVGYLQFPVTVSYHLYFGDFTLQPYAGIHYDVGLWGRDVTSIRVRSDKNPTLNTDEKTIAHLYEQKSLLRSDFGVVLGFGATYLERYYFGLSWEDGFLNISKLSDTRLINHSNFRLTVGYNF